MFLHLGKDYVIPLKEVIAIIDAKSGLKSKISKEFFKTAGEEGFINSIVDEDIKSYIITERVEKDKQTGQKIRNSIIYSSNISSNTLLKRCDFLYNSL